MNIRLTIIDKHVIRRSKTRACAGAIPMPVDRQAIVDCAVERPAPKVPKRLQRTSSAHAAQRLGGPAYDPAEAKRLLKEAGYDGAPVPYQYAEQLLHQQPAQTPEIHGSSNWKAIGPHVTIEMKEELGQILGVSRTRHLREFQPSGSTTVASLSAYAPGGQTWKRQWRTRRSLR